MEKNIISENDIRETAGFLKRIIAERSISGQEERLMQALKEEFLMLCDDVDLVKIPSDIISDPFYSNVKKNISYKDRHNLTLKIRGDSTETLIVNAHADVVPASDEMFEAYEKQGVVFGRGACDDKGQIAAIYLLLRAIRNSGKKPLKNLEVHIVAEEEIGGNGTLAMMQRDLSACLVIIMEPTDLNILTGSRGAVWFRAVTRGIAGHSGEAKSVKNALLIAVSLMDLLQRCHKKIFEKLKGVHPFENFDNPMPLTFGRLHSGEWPAMVPKEAVLEGVFGFLPGMTSKEIIEEILKGICSAGTEISGHVDVDFPLQRDPVVTSRELSCVKEFFNSVCKTGIKSQFSALPACCDLWFYSHEKRIPGVIFGAGELKYAHSDNEHIKLADIKTSALSIFNFLNSQGELLDGKV